MPPNRARRQPVLPGTRWRSARDMVSPLADCIAAGPASTMPSSLVRSSTMPYIDRYAPRTLDELCGNEQAKGSLLAHLRPDARTAIVMHGPPGVGKRSLVHLACAATLADFQVISIPLSLWSLADAIAATSLPTNVLSALQHVQRRRVLLYLDVEVLSRSDRTTLLHRIQAHAQSTSERCIVITSTALPKFEAIHVAMQPVGCDDIGVHLAWISAEEGVDLPAIDVAAGDVRAAITALQMRVSTTYSRPKPTETDVLASAQEEMPDDVWLCDRFADALCDLDCMPIEYANRGPLATHASMLVSHRSWTRPSTLMAHCNQVRGRQRLVIRYCDELQLAAQDASLAAPVYLHHARKGAFAHAGPARVDAILFACRSILSASQRRVLKRTIASARAD